jgi:hypothetical protein
MGAQASKPIATPAPAQIVLDEKIPISQDPYTLIDASHTNKSFGAELAPSHLAEWNKEFEEVHSVPHSN